MGTRMENNACLGLGETFCNYCKDGREAAVKEIQEMLKDNPDLVEFKSDPATGTGTCLHAAVLGGNSDLLEYLLSHLFNEEIALARDCRGDTAIHLAIMRNRVDLVKPLIAFQPKLCFERNKDKEPPLFMAVRMGILEVVKAFLEAEPATLFELWEKKNVLHLAVEHYHVHIVRFLTKHTDLKKIINHGVGLPLPEPDNPQNDSISQEQQSNYGKDDTWGDTPLHTAARNKCLQIVEFLLKVPEVDKYAVNRSGLTPLAIGMENTEYYEVYEIIEKLSDYPKGQRPFMYSAPSQSREKLKNGLKFVDDIYYKRQNVEIVVAVLLATMTFTAVFQLPGGFEKEIKDGRVIMTPTLIGSTAFKLFLGFDVLAFFLSLFVVYVWQVRPELTTREKMLVMRRNNQLLCTAFVFTAFGLIAALYVVLGQKLKIFSWGVVAIIFVVLLVCLATYYLAVRFAVRGARFSRLCGVFFHGR